MSASDSKVISNTPLDPASAKWIRLRSIAYLDPTGHPRLWESAERTTRPPGCAVDGVGIITILQKPSGPELLLQKQFRPPVGRVCIEVPAGLVDPGEGVGRCAERELKEETGFVGKAGEGVGPVMWNDPGFCNTNLNVVHVEVDMSLPENRDPKPELEPGEWIECFSVPLGDLWQECVKLAEQGYGVDARVGTIAEGIELAKRFKLHS